MGCGPPPSLEPGGLSCRIPRVLLLSRVLRVCRLLTPHAHFRLSNHYQWVIFLVIMVVAIIGIWVGACIWRRRYVRKKDRVTPSAPTSPAPPEVGPRRPQQPAPPRCTSAAAHVRPGARSGSAGVYGEKPQKSKKKWIVGDRT